MDVIKVGGGGEKTDDEDHREVSGEVGGRKWAGTKEGRH